MLSNIQNGFDYENSIPIACGIRYSNEGFNYVGSYKDAMDLYFNGFKRTLTLNDDGITLVIENPLNTSSGSEEVTLYTFYYRIVLMRILFNDSYMIGDVNNDGSITTRDAQLVENYLKGTITLNEKAKKAADVNKDGVVDSEDASLIQKFVVGQLKSF